MYRHIYALICPAKRAMGRTTLSLGFNRSQMNKINIVSVFGDLRTRIYANINRFDRRRLRQQINVQTHLAN